MAEELETTTTDADATATIVHIDTIRRHRQIGYMRDWLVAQTPWQGPLIRTVRERIQEAA